MAVSECKLLAGIDLGGTKTEIIVMQSDNLKELYRKRVPSPRDDYRATIQNMTNLVLEAEQELGAPGECCVGVGIPGIVSRHTGLVKNANSTWLNGQPLDRDLREALKRPVYVENDANCLALSESYDGAGASAHSVFCVIIGTGTGGGIVINKKIVQGCNQIGGEWGHNQLRLEEEEMALLSNPALPWSNCYCGRKGCNETFLSGPGFKNYYNYLAGTLGTEAELSNHDILSLYHKNDPIARKTMDVYEDRLARGLAAVINVIDPDAIVLGGGMSNLMNLYENVPDKIKKHVFSDTCDTKFLKAIHGDSSGVRGAALLSIM